MRQDKSNMTINKDILFYGIFIILLLFDNSVNTQIYSWALVGYAIFLVICCDPIFILIPCLLSSMLQGYFLITPTLSYARTLALLYIGALFIRGKTKLPKKGIYIYILIFAIYNVMTSFWSLNGSYSDSISLGISLVMIIFMSIHDTNRLKDFTKLLDFSIYCFGLLIFIYTIINSNSLQASQVVFDDSLNANTISMCVGLLAAIIYSRTLVSYRKHKLFDYGFIIICLITIVLAGSRTSLAAILVVLVVLPFAIGKNKKINKEKTSKKSNSGKILLIALVIVALIWILNQNEALLERFTFDSDSSVSVLRRYYVWEALIKYVIPQNLFFGVGFGISNVKLAVTPYVEFPYHAHNMMLGIISETGIIGFILYIAFFLYTAIIFKKHKNKYIGIAWAIFITGLFIGIGEEVINHRWFWMSIGFGLLFIRNENEIKENT